MPGPLAGLNVIEIAGLGPAPSCAMMLGDMGADVVRVDRVAKADLGVDLPPQFGLRDRNKRSVAIDLKHPAGTDALLRLIERADVLIEGFRPGVAERLGFGPSVCLKRRPRLVYARATGWGQEGPLALTAGHDINYIALTGALDMIGPAGGDPVAPLNLLGDYAGGAMFLAFGIACAVLEARQSGRGQIIDGAIIDGVTSLLTMSYAMSQAGRWIGERGANLFDGGAPHYAVYRTKDDRHVAVGALEDRFYAAFVAALGLDISALPSRADQANWPALRAQFASTFLQRTRDEWTAHFAAHPEACVSPVLSFAEAANHPHNCARATMVDFGGLQHPRPAPRLSRTPGAITGAPPRVGEHTRAVLAACGFSQAEIESGLQSGVFAADGDRQPGGSVRL